MRSVYGGVIVMGGAVSDGVTIRTAELLGTDLVYTNDIADMPANWLVQSIRVAGSTRTTCPGWSIGARPIASICY